MSAFASSAFSSPAFAAGAASYAAAVDALLSLSGEIVGGQVFTVGDLDATLALTSEVAGEYVLAVGDVVADMPLLATVAGQYLVPITAALDAKLQLLADFPDGGAIGGTLHGTLPMLSATVLGQYTAVSTLSAKLKLTGAVGGTHGRKAALDGLFGQLRAEMLGVRGVVGGIEARITLLGMPRQSDRCHNG